MSDFVLGDPATEHVTVKVIARAYPEASDYWDGNWLRTTLNIAVGAWRATYPADLRTDEFERFRDQMRTLYENLTGEAVFASMEGWLELHLKGDGLGHIRLEGSAQDSANEPASLEFTLQPTDQTYLPPMIDQLTAILDEYPIIGNRPKPIAKPPVQGRKGRFRRK